MRGDCISKPEVPKVLTCWLIDQAKSYNLNLSEKAAEEIWNITGERIYQIGQRLRKRAEDVARSLGVRDSTNIYHSLLEEWGRRMEEV